MEVKLIFQKMEYADARPATTTRKPENPLVVRRWSLVQQNKGKTNAPDLQ
jgi:hypothetical protein